MIEAASTFRVRRAQLGLLSCTAPSDSLRAASASALGWEVT